MGNFASRMGSPPSEALAIHLGSFVIPIAMTMKAQVFRVTVFIGVWHAASVMELDYSDTCSKLVIERSSLHSSDLAHDNTRGQISLELASTPSDSSDSNW